MNILIKKPFSTISLLGMIVLMCLYFSIYSKGISADSDFSKIEIPQDQYDLCTAHIENKNALLTEMEKPDHLYRTKVLGDLDLKRRKMMSFGNFSDKLKNGKLSGTSFRDPNKSINDWIGILNKIKITHQGIIITVGLACENGDRNGEVFFRNNMSDILIDIDTEIYNELKILKGGDLMKITGIIKKSHEKDFGDDDVNIINAIKLPHLIFDFSSIKKM